MSSALPIRTLADLGQSVRAARQAAGLQATQVARKAERSRDLLHRLETGKDVTTSALIDVLRAMGYTIRLERLGLPTLDEMRQRFAEDDE
ncbi:helix-turn-helix domain-containing protein [Ottowia caeni]|uniref:helix-turn-helix domain-containing protein n=1 Tax=Ottowia caeni TaxID=2870339 RepID=UPI001E2E2F06|nr:helix-turn-helix domain-containing protein [Ottowia caeni]